MEYPAGSLGAKKAELEALIDALESKLQQCPEYRPKVVAVFADIGRMVAHAVAIDRLTRFYQAAFEPMVIREIDVDRIKNLMDQFGSEAKVSADELMAFGESLNKKLNPVKPKGGFVKGKNNALNRVICKNGYC